MDFYQFREEQQKPKRSGPEWIEADFDTTPSIEVVEHSLEDAPVELRSMYLRRQQ